MKQTIWIVSYDESRNGVGSSPHGTLEAAEAEFKTMVTAAWEDWADGEVMPENAHAAYQWLLDNVGSFSDTYEIEQHEIDVPFPKFDVNIEAALCSWEWLLSKDQDELWASVADGIGSPGMRMVSVHAGQIVLSVYNLMEARGYEFTYAYDFDFVPAVLSQLDWPTLVDNNQYGDGSYRPDPAPMLDRMMKEHPEQFADRWIDDARREAKKQWGYEELVSDHEDSIDRTETPAEWVRRIGTKYDLIPAWSW